MCIIGLHVKYCVYIIIIPYDNIIRLKLAKTRKNSQKLAKTRKNSQKLAKTRKNSQKLANGYRNNMDILYIHRYCIIVCRVH